MIGGVQLEEIVVTVDKRAKRNNGHTEAWWKRHSSSQHSREYNRAFARSVMKRFVTDMRRNARGLPIKSRRDVHWDEPTPQPQFRED